MHRLGVVLVLALSATAAADPIDREDGSPDAHVRALRGGGLGAIDVVPVGQGAVTVQSSYDNARDELAGVAGGEILIARRVYAIGGALHEPGSLWRPYIGAKVAVLPELAISAVYKAEGFTEPEGEVELRIAAAHAVGPGYAVINAVYGQEFDGNERDVEGAGALLFSVSDHVIASTQSRARFALASTKDLHGDWDLVADVGAAYTFGRYSARAGAGISAVGAMRVMTGPMASVSIATFF